MRAIIYELASYAECRIRSRKRLQLVTVESIPKSKKAKTIVNLLCLEEAGRNKYCDFLHTKIVMQQFFAPLLKNCTSTLQLEL